MDGMTEFEKLLWKEITDQREKSSKERQAIRDDIASLKEELAVHKVKSGFWGSVGGSIVVGFAMLIEFLKGR